MSKAELLKKQVTNFIKTCVVDLLTVQQVTYWLYNQKPTDFDQRMN